MVTAENNDAELVCRASNAWFPSDSIEDKRIISVACKLIIIMMCSFLVHNKEENKM